ncbi:ABC-F family ATP-binding cassette domain-containing protein [Sneathia sp. DSM 16631]|nr:ABC-F family ATP-binding cassette domain-containing protein [Sneathia sp. DSM 16631]MBE3031477.1 ABC-F family ATP-binding cassette domain-containing protein [Sneathia sp. DSM 16631]MDK9581553.1 ABC-F family ATP-binding cassette domain-containing protein [Sneathia vaginalis]
MAFIQFNNVYKSFLDKQILKDVSFSINSSDRIGLIGLNGVGKSTIINIILSKESINSGTVFVDKNINIGYISQVHHFSDENNTVFEELDTVFSELHKVYRKIEKMNLELATNPKLKDELDKLYNIFNANDGYSIDYLLNQVINGLDLTNLKDSLICKLSGGEKTRVSLAKLLLQKPDLLILDEPTNHLDLASIEWLEEFLKKYNKAFLLVSHDRVFLDNVCNKIFEIENMKLHEYSGNFSSFMIQKEMILKGEIKEYEKQQDRIKKLNEYIERNRAGRMAKQARGKQKLLSHLLVHDNPDYTPPKMKLKFEIKNTTSDSVLTLENVCKNFDNKALLKDICLKVYKGERIGIIGKNGCGKSTLLKLIANKLPLDSGSIKIAQNAVMGYFDQNVDNLYPDNTILQEINTNINYTQEYLRSMAASFLFKDEDVDKRIKDLSGGEKVRVSFIKLIQKHPNFLLLDEPTNHLDIYSIEILEQALSDFQGTLVVVSHNRHFLDSVCNTIYVLDENGLTKFKGNYNDYKESIKKKTVIEKEKDTKNEYILQKEKSKKISKLKRLISSTEEELEKIGKRKSEINKAMFLPDVAKDIEKLVNLQNELDDLSKKEDTLMEEWQKYSLDLEEENEI